MSTTISNTTTPDTSPTNISTTNSPNTSTPIIPKITLKDAKKAIFNTFITTDKNDPKITFKGIVKSLTNNKTDLDKPYFPYEYDQKAVIVNPNIGENDFDVTNKIDKDDDTFPELTITDTIDTTTTDSKFKLLTDKDMIDSDSPYQIPLEIKNNSSEEIEREDDIGRVIQPQDEYEQQDISNYDNNFKDIAPLDYIPPAEENEIDVIPPDTSYYEPAMYAHKRNPYISTLVFFIPAFFMMLMVMGMRGLLSFTMVLTCVIGFSIVWFFTAAGINLLNNKAPTEGLFNLDGSINFNIPSKDPLIVANFILDSLNGIIGILYQFVHYFTDFYVQALDIMNIRKLYFLVTLSICMMTFLYIMDKLGLLPLSALNLTQFV
jgi:hypothetical protein